VAPFINSISKPDPYQYTGSGLSCFSNPTIGPGGCPVIILNNFLKYKFIYFGPSKHLL
jgi:hypothetical protein